MAAGEFRLGGKLVDYKAKMEMSRELTTDDGTILRLGHNDVQHAGGGLYPHEQDAIGTSEGLGLQCR